ncbi:MAG: SDR family NAD(P)-dependent oxidoreductase [Candidatus Kapabacteria bacterium]|jgi:3-oxoacyl-[acyl-carrier protein] reductase|nr:SDR family NAD(P)-dependent oxidoreductase [Candidatus Kapabacteria bacterium]
MNNQKIMLITGSRKGLGRQLSEYYLEQGYKVIGCSRSEAEFKHENYEHFITGVSDEKTVKKMFAQIRKRYGRIDVLLNNAGIASMNHFLLTPASTVEKIFDTNFLGTFLFCREAAKIMKKNKFGRIINFSTVATEFNLEGEAAYVASKAAVESLTKIIARELADDGITVNAIAPSLVKTDLIKNVPPEKLEGIIQRQAIRRFTEFRDVVNVLDFFIKPESDFISGQVMFLGGVS